MSAFLESSPLVAIIGTFIAVIVYMMNYHKWKYKYNFLFSMLFVYYVLRVVSITLLPLHSFDMKPFSELIYSINLIPFGNNQGGIINSLEFSQCIFNAIMFMPLGILLPLMIHKKIKMKYFILLCFIASLSIEFLQITGTYFGLISRSFDVNDIIFNVMGGSFTYGFASFIHNCLYKHYLIEQKEQAKSLS